MLKPSNRPILSTNKELQSRGGNHQDLIMGFLSVYPPSRIQLRCALFIPLLPPLNFSKAVTLISCLFLLLILVRVIPSVDHFS